MSMTQPVWITGVGAVTPLGNSLAEFATNLLAGKSGVATHHLFTDDPPTRQIAAAVDTIPLPRNCDAGQFATWNRLEQLATSCTGRALEDAGLEEHCARIRVGLVLGMGAEYLRVWEMDMHGGGKRVFEPGHDAQSLVHAIRARLGLSGPATTVAAACASAGFALAMGRRWVQSGLVDVCLAGGCDLITPMSYAAFYNLRALSRREDDPVAASRPFDRDRDGFVMGEGGAVFALESASHARRRRAAPLAEFAGFGASSDAAHMVIPSSDPEPASLAIRQALGDAEVNPDEVDYVNAHATSTPVGDRAEARALQLALGEAVARVPVSSTKSMTGHLLSGAAAVETMACIVALRHQALPPTINLDQPDPECGLVHVPNQSRPAAVKVTVSDSFGFGGSNTCVVLRRAA